MCTRVVYPWVTELSFEANFDTESVAFSIQYCGREFDVEFVTNVELPVDINFCLNFASTLMYRIPSQC